ncbi:Lipase/lipooxygenase, PLAT/LH2 [Artemisia annua]|uniref:Lipase/lipooxygenase, PLAT/LH2 n=1 Tax=Artemisia annua TaxID=35608 RepID=A0A2U1PP98_ARTAN|nr:Lipase/lipooxygenase, PLAT/LH2 [Artemisia annua]
MYVSYVARSSILIMNMCIHIWQKDEIEWMIQVLLYYATVLVGVTGTASSLANHCCWNDNMIELPYLRMIQYSRHVFAYSIIFSWYMHTREELIEPCTSIICVASALHTIVNFGQYPYVGLMPNRPPLSNRLLPEPGTIDYDELKTNREKAFLKTMTPKLRIILGERDTPEWTTDNEALEVFKNFGANFIKIEKKIDEMNLDERLRNRTGPAQI